MSSVCIGVSYSSIDGWESMYPIYQDTECYCYLVISVFLISLSSFTYLDILNAQNIVVDRFYQANFVAVVIKKTEREILNLRCIIFWSYKGANQCLYSGAIGIVALWLVWDWKDGFLLNRMYQLCLFCFRSWLLLLLLLLLSLLLLMLLFSV